MTFLPILIAVCTLTLQPCSDPFKNECFQTRTPEKTRVQRIAVVNMKKVFENYYRRIEMDQKLKKIADVANAQLEAANDEMMKLKREFSVLDDNTKDIMLSSAERDRIREKAKQKYREWKDQEARCVELKDANDKKLKENYDTLRAMVLKEIQDEVQRRAVAGGYDLVLDLSGETFSGISAVIYASPTIDLTDEVLRELNKSKPKTSLSQS